MTTQITYRTASYGSSPAGRAVAASAARPAGNDHARSLSGVVARLRRRGWFRWLDTVPEALRDDVAVGPHILAGELRGELNRLDSALHVRFY